MGCVHLLSIGSLERLLKVDILHFCRRTNLGSGRTLRPGSATQAVAGYPKLKWPEEKKQFGSNHLTTSRNILTNPSILYTDSNYIIILYRSLIVPNVPQGHSPPLPHHSCTWRVSWRCGPGPHSWRPRCKLISPIKSVHKKRICTPFLQYDIYI